MSSAEQDKTSCPIREGAKCAKENIVGQISRVMKETEQSVQEFRDAHQWLHKQAGASLRFYRERIIQALDSISLNDIINEMDNGGALSSQVERKRISLENQLIQLKNYNDSINAKWNNIENTNSNCTDGIDPAVEFFCQAANCQKEIKKIEAQQNNRNNDNEQRLIDRKISETIKSAMCTILVNSGAVNENRPNGKNFVFLYINYVYSTPTCISIDFFMLYF